jgi:hypothetical protein
VFGSLARFGSHRSNNFPSVWFVFLQKPLLKAPLGQTWRNAVLTVSSEPPPFRQNPRTPRSRRATMGDGTSSRGMAKSRRDEFGHRT